MKTIMKYICSYLGVLVLLVCFNVLTMHLGCHNRIVSNIVAALLSIIMLQATE